MINNERSWITVNVQRNIYTYAGMFKFTDIGFTMIFITSAP